MLFLTPKLQNKKKKKKTFPYPKTWLSW